MSQNSQSYATALRPGQYGATTTSAPKNQFIQNLASSSGATDPNYTASLSSSGNTQSQGPTQSYGPLGVPSSGTPASSSFTTPSGAKVDSSGNTLSAPPSNAIDNYRSAMGTYLSSLTATPEEKNARTYLNKLLGNAQQDQEKALNSGETLGFATGEAGRVGRQNQYAIDSATRGLDALTGYRAQDTTAAKARLDFEQGLFDLQNKPISLPYGGSLYYPGSGTPGTGTTVGGFTSNVATNNTVAKAMQEGRLDPTLLTRYGLPFVLQTLQQNPDFNFNQSHTTYARGIADSTHLTFNPLTGAPVTYQSKGGAPSGSAAPNGGGSALPSQPGALGGGSSISSATATPSASNIYSTTPLPPPTNKVQLKYQQDLTSGDVGKQVNSLNTAVGHLFDANSYFNELNNGAVQKGNSIKNFISTQAGQAAAGKYGQAQDLLSTEIANAYGAGALGDREAQKHYGSAIDSPEQHKAYVGVVSTFLSSKIAANVQSYRNAMGKDPSSLDVFISPVNQVKLSSMGLNVKGLVPGLAPSATADSLINNAHSVNGEVYIPVDPANPKGAYQKLQ